MADGYRHVYHVEGVTDRDAQYQAAVRRGQAFIVHEHPAGKHCNDDCKAHWPSGRVK